MESEVGEWKAKEKQSWRNVARRETEKCETKKGEKIK